MNNSNKIQELRDRYRESFVDKSEVIVEFLQSLSDYIQTPLNPQTPVNRQRGRAKVCNEIHEYMHKFAGSSGMYDYPDIAELCRAAMRSSSQNEVQLLAEQLSDLRDLLQQYDCE